MSSIDGGDRLFSQPRREPQGEPMPLVPSEHMRLPDSGPLTLDEIERKAIERGDGLLVALVAHVRRTEKKIDGWLEAERFRGGDHR